MRRFYWGVAVIAVCCLRSVPGFAQRNCGLGYLFHKLNAENPALMQQLRDQHQSLIAEAQSIPGTGAKGTALSRIPIVFHFVLTSSQYALVGGDSGIKRRVNSQLTVLNNDYNGANADASLIPANFKPLYANIGATFGLADVSSPYTITNGIELRIVNGSTNYQASDACSAAKHEAAGLTAWDVSKYLNVWVANITGASGSGVILGITVPPSLVYQTPYFPESELGISLNYGAIGSREFPSQNFIYYIDKGRTLTHEMGHFFELWHIWGDDGGKCPGGVGGQDDGISDTPPQADATYCNFGTCPTYPKYDNCSTSPGNGIMFMNYMDYTDDASMYMFTQGQSALMRAQFALPTGMSYRLTQNPGLAKLNVDDTNNGTTGAGWSIAPNPSTGSFHLTLQGAEGFRGAQVLNMTGQIVADIVAQPGIKEYNINLSNAAKGFYLVRCHYDNGTLTKKLLIE
jgi:hypothetical protein